LTLREKLAAGRFVITAEVDPPRGTAIARTLEEVRAVRPFVDAVNLWAVELIRLAAGLNRGRNWAGGELEGRARLFLGAAANPGARDLALEAEKTRAKIEAGARFFQTQPVFSLDEVEAFLKALGGIPEGVFFLFGILPLVSVRMAERVATWANVPGRATPGREGP